MVSCEHHMTCLSLALSDSARTSKGLYVIGCLFHHTRQMATTDTLSLLGTHRELVMPGSRV